MNSKFQPDPNSFDDVEGHATLRGSLLPDGRDYDKFDVEGHAIQSGRIDGPDADDTEGHGISSGRIDGPDTDDVEGHAYSGRMDRLDTQAAAARGTSRPPQSHPRTTRVRRPEPPTGSEIFWPGYGSCRAGLAAQGVDVEDDDPAAAELDDVQCEQPLEHLVHRRSGATDQVRYLLLRQRDLDAGGVAVAVHVGSSSRRR